jgi:adenine/guanine phosphoribosyltransferase-like PRPP-binding protein
MRKNLLARKLIERLNEKVQRRLDLDETLILGVVLKGLPVAYGLARMNRTIDNFVPLVAQRHIYMQHHVESYFPSSEWKEYFSRQLQRLKSLLIVDDVVNTGFTRQRVEGVVHSLDTLNVGHHAFAALVLNCRNLANPRFVNANDVFALKVNAEEVDCDWGQITVPLWNLSVRQARERCEEYYVKFWLHESRFVSVTYQDR